MRKVKIYIAIFALSVISLKTLGNNNTDHINQGTSHLSELEIENAIHAFSEAIEKNHKIVDAYLHRAEAYLLNGDCEKAAEDYVKAFDLDPEYVRKKLNIDSEKQSVNSTVFDFTETEY